MSGTTYRIRKGFLIPMAITVVLGVVLLFIGIWIQLPSGRLYLLAAFMAPALLIFIESSRRRVHIHSDHILMERTLGKKQLDFGDLTSVDAVRVRKRVFISLTTENSFMIISNSYDRFDELVRRLIDLVPQATLSAEARQLAADPPRKCSDIFSAWLAVAVLLLVIATQLRSIF
ncbi:MAG: hypothetical protein K0A94_06250 [Desulfuromonadales bacterium]|nr:hypothetical protein [Desulfuromonadales bacterium]